MNIRCYVVDDEPAALNLMMEYVEQTPGLELVGASLNPAEAIDYLTGPEAPDITFVDVDMRLISGLELAGMVNLYTTVVFTTAFPQYAVQAFEKEVFDYLLKPITYERFIKCIQRVKRKKKEALKFDYPIREDFFNIKSEIKGRIVKVKFDDVIFIEGAVNYIQVHTTDSKHMTYLTMREIERSLPKPLFVRIHRSFIINVNYVKLIEHNQVIMRTGDSLAMGNNYKEQFVSLMDAHLVKTDRKAG